MAASNEMQSVTEHVHHLNSKTLKSFIDSTGVVLLSVVLLPASKRCQLFVPEYEKIANVMQDSKITFAQINSQGNGDVLAPFDISTFPHVILFQGFGNFRVYRGALKKRDITTYLDRFLQFPVLSTVSAKSLSEFKRSNDVVVVGYVADEDVDSKGQFESLAKTMHPEYVFGITNDSTLAKHEGIDVPGVAVYKPFDEEKYSLPLIPDIDQMITNLRKTARPLIIEVASETHENILEMGIPFGYVFSNTSEEQARLRKEIEPMAREYRQSLQFGIADSNNLHHIADDLHLNITHSPAFAIREPAANLRYPMNEMTGSFNDSVKSFVRDYLDGKLKPTIKSEPIPGKPKGALVKVVGLNYQQIVMNETKDVLLTFCISPCAPCEVFLPTLTGLAEVYASHSKLKDKITVARVMYDVNDTPERNVRAFPTTKLYPAASKNESVTFFGPRTLDNLAEFIREYGTHKGDLRDSDKEQAGGEEALAESQGVCMPKNGGCR